MGRKSRFESMALKYAYERYIGKDAARAEAFEEELANADVARKIYDLRTRAALTQRELARLVGTSPSVISRLEDADYEGHSLAMLRRVAARSTNAWKSVSFRSRAITNWRSSSQTLSHPSCRRSSPARDRLCCPPNSGSRTASNQARSSRSSALTSLVQSVRPESSFKQTCYPTL